MVDVTQVLAKVETGNRGISAALIAKSYLRTDYFNKRFPYSSGESVGSVVQTVISHVFL